MYVQYTHKKKKGPWDRGATRPSRAVGAASSASPRSTRKCAAVVRLRESRCKGQAKFWGAATNSFSLLSRGNIDRIASEAGARERRRSSARVVSHDAIPFPFLDAWFGVSDYPHS
jgi:hypothetical protein